MGNVLIGVVIGGLVGMVFAKLADNPIEATPGCGFLFACIGGAAGLFVNLVF